MLLPIVFIQPENKGFMDLLQKLLFFAGLFRIAAEKLFNTQRATGLRPGGKT